MSCRRVRAMRCRIRIQFSPGSFRRKFTALDLPVFGVHVSIDGASWTCGAVRGWDVDGLADGLEALLA